MTDVTRLNVNELAEFTQVWGRFVRNDIPNELVKSIDGGNLPCSLHRKVQSVHFLL